MRILFRLVVTVFALIGFAVTALLLIGTSLTRAQIAGPLVWSYETATGQTIRLDEPHFRDIGDLTTDEQMAIEKLWAARITAGTGPDSYSPHERVPLWQLLIFSGKLLWRITDGLTPVSERGAAVL